MGKAQEFSRHGCGRIVGADGFCVPCLERDRAACQLTPDAPPRSASKSAYFSEWERERAFDSMQASRANAWTRPIHCPPMKHHDLQCDVVARGSRFCSCGFA